MTTKPDPHATFRVEKIIAISILEDNLKFYKVQWAPSWVADTNLKECEKLVAEFLNKNTLQCLEVDGNVAYDNSQNQIADTTNPECWNSVKDGSSIVDVKVEPRDDDGDLSVSCPTSTSNQVPVVPFSDHAPIETALIESDDEGKPAFFNTDLSYDDKEVHRDIECQQPSIIVDEDSPLSDDGEISGVNLINKKYDLNIDRHSQTYQNRNTQHKPKFGPASYSGFKSCQAGENFELTTEYGGCSSLQAQYQDNDQKCTRKYVSEINHYYSDSMAFSEPWNDKSNISLNKSNHSDIDSYSDAQFPEHGNSIDSQTTDGITSLPIPESLRILTADAGGMFNCPRCPRSFPLKHKLMRHYTCHTKPFRCDECNKTFGRKDNLKRHMTLHVGRPHPNSLLCSMCQAPFSSNEAYLEHLKEQHDGDSWMCSEGVARGGTSVEHDDTGGVPSSDIF